VVTSAAADLQPIYARALQTFEQQHPGVTAEVVSTAGQNHLDKVTAALAAGTPYDVIGNLAPSDTPGFAARKQVRPLDDLVRRDRYDLSDFAEKCLAQYRWRGPLYALPRGFGNQDVYYNRALLDAAGIPPPPYDWTSTGWTVQDFLDAARRLTRPTGDTNAVWGWAQGTSLRQWAPWVWTFGGEVLSADGRRCTLDAPPAVDGLQFLQDLIYKHRVMAPPATNLSLISGLGTGQLAMAMDIPANLAGYRRVQGLSFDVAPMPRQTMRLTSGGGVAWHLAAATPSVDAAWALQQWLASKDVQDEECRAGTVAPPRKSVLRSPCFVDRSQPPKGIDVFVQAPAFVHPDPQALDWTDINAEIENGLASLWDGSRTARQVMQDVVPQVNRLLQASAA
jgi:multiple sugar transport system substrate-binding protein